MEEDIMGCDNKCRCGKTVVDENTKFVDSASDDRIVNNKLRHKYRVLSDEEKEMMTKVKDKGIELLDLIDEVRVLKAVGNDGYELDIGSMKVEEAVMWICKNITK